MVGSAGGRRPIRNPPAGIKKGDRGLSLAWQAMKVELSLDQGLLSAYASPRSCHAAARPSWPAGRGPDYGSARTPTAAAARASDSVERRRAPLAHDTPAGGTKFLAPLKLPRMSLGNLQPRISVSARPWLFAQPRSSPESGLRSECSPIRRQLWPLSGAAHVPLCGLA